MENSQFIFRTLPAIFLRESKAIGKGRYQVMCVILYELH